MKVLVTGANGFLGSWLTRRLCEEGHEVSILIRGSSDEAEIKDLKLNKKFGDVTNIESLYSAFREEETIFHLAGLIAYKKSQREQMENVNVRGTKNVIKVIQDLQIPELVYMSSVVAIGVGFKPTQILNESSEYNIKHLNLGYFETKHAAEEIVKAACSKKNLRGIILNPSTVYGAGDAKKGSRGTQLKVAQGKFPFYTNGGVSIVAVEDVIEGVMLAWKKGKSGERYILSGENLTILELFTLIAAFAKVKAPSTQVPFSLLKALGYSSDLLETIGLPGFFSLENAWTANLYHWFDSAKAQKELGFKPKPAAEALEKSVRWMKDSGLLNK